MHLTQIQEKMFQDTTDAVLAMGGMETKYSNYPLVMMTQAGRMRTRPEFDGIEVLFEEPAKAQALGIECHSIKGTMKLDLPLGSYNNPAAMTALIERYKAFVKPLLTK